MAEDFGDKTEAPTPRRREEAREQGQVARSADLTAAALLMGFLLLMNSFGPGLMKALSAALTAKGFRVGKPLFVKFARIGVQDEIGLLTRAKSTLIVVGERPGLGTGDSLSIYTAYGPKLAQDNAEKDCISNVRAVGFPPERAALKCAELMKRSFAAGGGGVRLTGGDPAIRPHQVSH